MSALENLAQAVLDGRVHIEPTAVLDLSNGYDVQPVTAYAIRVEPADPRLAAELDERRAEARIALATLDEPTRLAALDTVAHDNPDAFTDALRQNGDLP